MPFLENVTRGRGIPPERLASVAEHYLHFGGVSPINGINRALIDEIRAELAERGGAVAGVLRQPQLASDGRRHRCRNGFRGGASGRGVRHLGVGAGIPGARNTRRTSPAPVPASVTVPPRNW